MKSLLLSLFLLISVQCFADTPLGTVIAYTGNMHKPTSAVIVDKFGTYNDVPGDAWAYFYVVSDIRRKDKTGMMRMYAMKVDCVSSHSYWMHYIETIVTAPTGATTKDVHPMSGIDFNNPGWGERRDITDSTTSGTIVKSATEVFPLSLPLYAFVATYLCIATGEGNLDN